MRTEDVPLDAWGYAGVRAAVEIAHSATGSSSACTAVASCARSPAGTRLPWWRTRRNSTLYTKRVNSAAHMAAPLDSDDTHPPAAGQGVVSIVGDSRHTSNHAIRQITYAEESLRNLVGLVACPRQLHSGFRSAAPGWQGATTENTRTYLREEQRRQTGCPARKPLSNDEDRPLALKPVCDLEHQHVVGGRAETPRRSRG